MKGVYIVFRTEHWLWFSDRRIIGVYATQDAARSVAQSFAQIEFHQILE